MQYIAKAALIIASGFLAYHTGDYRLLIFWFLAMFNWD